MSHDELRLSDNERMTALQALGTHYAEGRLDITEFNDRTEKAAVARTLGELRPLFDDLPGGIPFQAGSLTPQLPVAQPSDASQELMELKKKGELVQRLDVVFSVVGGGLFFLGLMLGWHYSWLGMLAAGGAMMLSRAALKFNESDEKTFEKLAKQEDKDRQKRLLEADNRIKELGS